jgi:RHS repeat-associated protein
VSSGSTETITLQPGTAATQYFYNNVNELVAYAAGGPIRYQGVTNKPVKSASVGTDVVTITAAAPNPTTYAGSTNVGATETITFGTNSDGNVAATIGGTVTTGDVLTITTYNATLTNGQEPVAYTVPMGATLTSIAAGIASAIDADANLPKIGVSATSSVAVVNISVTRPTYTSSTSGGATETITLGTNNSGSSSATIGGTPSMGNTLTITTHYPSLPTGQVSDTYTVLSTDTIVTIAAGLAAAMNADSHITGLGISASAGSNATLNWSENFTANAPIGPGTNTTTASATDGGNNTQTNTYQVSTNPASSTSLTFDANGNMTSDGTNTYAWDADDRLIQVTYPGSGNYSQFTYDGLGHDVKILEYSGGTLSSTKQFVWCGDKMCEARNASSSITAQYFEFGQTISGSNYYYVLDRPGSIVILVDSSGNVAGAESYDPYGRVTQTQGSLSSDFQYAGYYYHAPSGLNLTVHRAYSSVLGRLLNRDPIQELGGVNLFAYVRNNPTNLNDPDGTNVWTEGPSGREPPGHCSVCIGSFQGGYSCYSYGAVLLPLPIGAPYQDRFRGGPILRYKKTTPAQDLQLELELLSHPEAGYYGPGNICCDYANKWFDSAPGPESQPPYRESAPWNWPPLPEAW